MINQGYGKKPGVNEYEQLIYRHRKKGLGCFIQLIARGKTALHVKGNIISSLSLNHQNNENDLPLRTNSQYNARLAGTS